MRYLIELVLIVVYCTSMLGCFCIAHNRNSFLSVCIGVVPIVNTAYMIYRCDDCNMIEILDGAKTNIEKDIEKL